MMVVGAILAPDGSPITMMLLAGPMYVLFESSIWIIVLLEKSWKRSAETPVGGVKELVDEFLVLFANVLFAVSLFAVWGVLTLIGVIVDQNKGADFYWQNYTPVLARIVLRLHLDNIYHSPAYIGIIGLILISMTVATFRRVIPARLPALRPVKIDKIPLNASISVEGDEADVRERVQRFFAGRGWQIRKREFGGEEWSFVDKHNWARRGVLVAHVGFVIIAAGTTIYWASGYSGQFTVLSGTTATIPQTGATVALKQFGYRIHPVATKSGIVYQPIDYVSHAVVTGKDGVAHDAVIRVNQPYDVDGVKVYQATYGFGITFALTKDGRPIAGPPTRPDQRRRGLRHPRHDARDRVPLVRRHDRPPHRPSRARPAAQRSGRGARGLRRQRAARRRAGAARNGRSTSARATRSPRRNTRSTPAFSTATIPASRSC